MGRVENIVEKGENTSYQHFLLLQQCLQMAPFMGLLKVVGQVGFYGSIIM